MLSPRLLRDFPDRVRAGLMRRRAGDEALRMLDEWRALDAERRTLAAGAEAARQIDRRAAGQRETLGQIDAIQRAMRERDLQLPNLPDDRTPEPGIYDVELRWWGEPPAFDFAPRTHDDLAAALGILDLPRATRLAGPRFPLLLGSGARLSRALASLMLDLHVAAGYTEVAPPHLLRVATLEGTGHLPRHALDLYDVPRDELYLSPTAEAQLVALHAGETLQAARLPLAYTACTPAFRREAGSARATTHGLLRQHQFDKVELVRIATVEDADAAFERILADAERVLRALELPYRVRALAADELPFSSQRTVDLEVWMAGQGRYVEVSSVSDCGTFQMRRLRTRVRRVGGGGLTFPSSLNGSALAIGRTLAALLENGQRADSTVTLPAALGRYAGFTTLE